METKKNIFFNYNYDYVKEFYIANTWEKIYNCLRFYKKAK
jgi:hypothetical protein